MEADAAKNFSPASQPQATASTCVLHLRVHDITQIAWIENAAGICLDCNQALSRFARLPVESLIGQNVLEHLAWAHGISDLTHLKGNPSFFPVMARAHVQEADDGLAQAIIRIPVNTDANGETGSLCVVHETAESPQKKFSGPYTQHNRRLPSNIPAEIAFCYQSSQKGCGNFPYISPVLDGLYDFTPDDLQQDASLLLASVHPDDITGFLQSFKKAQREQQRWQHAFRTITKDRQIVTQCGHAVPQKMSDESICWFGALTQKTPDAAANDDLAPQINPDNLLEGLHALANRYAFRENLDQLIDNARLDNTSFALVVIDLDHFQEINDALGHEIGDAFLADTATRLRQSVRRTDVVGHLGGDEFVIALRDLREQEAIERVVCQILQTLSEPFRYKHLESRISGSIGIALYPADGSNVDDLLKYANQAMYVSKKSGRNRFTFFTPSMHVAAQKRVTLISDLRKTVDHFPFKLLFQPIVDLRNDALCKAEALIRWVHPVRGIVSPAEFIPLAEEIGLIDVIGDWVFYRAAEQVEKWRRTIASDFQISINMSPLQFRSNNRFPGPWSEHLKNISLQGNGILLEITEGLLLDTQHGIANQIHQFHAAGIQVALDDFGTGYSSLSHLAQYDIDYIKIDRCFVQNITSDASALALCQAMILLAHRLGMQVIAEGVETDAQRELLKNAGCDFAQGYLFSPPVPPDEFEDLLIGPLI